MWTAILEESKKLGLNSTPSFVINGYIVKGADLVKIIDAIEYFQINSIIK